MAVFSIASFSSFGEFQRVFAPGYCRDCHNLAVVTKVVIDGRHMETFLSSIGVFFA